MSLIMIGNATVSGSGITYLEFTSISQDYDHLLLQINAADRGTAGNSYDLFFNGDTTNANYNSTALEGNGGSSVAYTWTRDGQIGTSMIQYPTSISVVIPDYSSSTRKGYVWDSGPTRPGTATVYINWGQGTWQGSTDAISSVRVRADNAMADGSTVTLWAYQAGSDGTTTVS